MRQENRFGFLLTLTFLALIGAAGSRAHAQPISSAVAKPTAPINTLPDPYRSVENWARLPDGRMWGSSAGVYVDPKGTSIWVAERCGANSCAGSDEPTAL